MEDEFGSLQKMHVPHCDDAIGLVQRCRVLVVRRAVQLGILFRRESVSTALPQPINTGAYLGRPIHVCNRAIFAIPFVKELAEKLHSPSFRVVSKNIP